MTIKKRLFLSNILMILVPVAAAALVGLLCVGAIWLLVVSGAGLDMHDTEDFQRVSLAVTEYIEHHLEGEDDFSALTALLDSNGMAAEVYQGETLVYSFGSREAGDDALEAAAAQLTGNAVVSQNGRSLYQSHETVDGTEYLICLLGGSSSARAYGNLKAALILSVALLFLVIFLAVLLTNRFLTRFVFRKIEGPLEILTNGVHEIRDGNLDFHISYDREDEFLPVCDAFNEMTLRLRESVAQTQRQERSRKELLAGISHDIRSPLTSIQAYVEGLLDGVARTPEAQRRYLLTVKAKAEELEHLVSELFLFSKMELGDFPENAAVFRLDTRIAAAVSEAKAEYAARGLTLETALEPVTVKLDPTQLDRVLANIMGNSLKYKTAERGLLRISLKKDGARCTLTFDDDGPGVPEEALPHLFEVFYRSDPARQNPQKGSGLGLAIVEKLVTHAGGSVAAKKSALGGLNVTLRLPCAEEGGEPNA